MLFEGDDIGRWLARQREASTWAQLSTGHQERLTKLGVQPAEQSAPTAANGGGMTALAQWVEREGANRPVPRGHGEEITVGGESEPVVVKLGVWVSSTKSRRDKLTQEQQAALRELGMQWATPVGGPSKRSRAPSGRE